MANRDNHYEAAFEAYLREKEVPYVAVDERRRSLPGEHSIKNVDFIVSPREQATEFVDAPSERSRSWLVDVKGRRFPSGTQSAQYWKNWSTRDDLVGLRRWESLFGEPFRGLFVFAYELVADRSPTPVELTFCFRERRYAFVAMPLAFYERHARPLSPKWGTVSVPVARFRELARPFLSWL